MESLENLLQKQKELSEKIDAVRHQQKKEGLAQIVALVEQYQFSPDEVMTALGKRKAGPKKGMTVAPKYRNPATGATWTGRGKPPTWIADKNRDQFLIR